MGLDLCRGIVGVSPCRKQCAARGHTLEPLKPRTCKPCKDVARDNAT